MTMIQALHGYNKLSFGVAPKRKKEAGEDARVDAMIIRMKNRWSEIFGIPIAKLIPMSCKDFFARVPDWETKLKPHENTGIDLGSLYLIFIQEFQKDSGSSLIETVRKTDKLFQDMIAGGKEIATVMNA